jgi:hypothetical protein
MNANVVYQNGYNAQTGSPQPSMDRARGGTVSITLVIPPQTLAVVGVTTKGDAVAGVATLRQMQTTFTIDMEQLPLVNVAGYRVDEQQIGPPVLPYPVALPNGVAPLTHVFV